MAEAINDIQDEIVEEFSLFEDWMDKYQHIIDLGKDLPLIENQYKDENHLVKGCQSQVWLHSEIDSDGVVSYSADSDAVITKGMIALLVRTLSGQPGDEIVKADMSFIDKIGLKEHLSPTRSNGLVAMINKMKAYAAMHLTDKH